MLDPNWKEYDFSKYEMSTAAYELYASSAREDMNFDNLGKTADLENRYTRKAAVITISLDDYINKYGVYLSAYIL